MPEQRWNFKAEQLRIIAEAAAGLPTGAVRYIVERGGRLHLVEEATGEVVLLTLTGAEQPAPGGSPAFEVELRIEADGAGIAPSPRKLRKGFDAFFWSRAAVRKFVLPYYLPLYGADKILALQNELQLPKYVGVLHGDYSPLNLTVSDGTLSSPFYTLENEGLPLVAGGELPIRPLDRLLGP